MDKTVQQIATVVRALVASRKPPATLDDILRDYRDNEGEHIPFRKLGYGSAVDLLTDSGQFIFNNLNGMQTIRAKTSEKSAHIVSMVREQNTGKSKRTVHQPQRAPMRPCNNNWNSYGGGDVRERHNNSNYFQNNAAVRQQPQQFPQRIAPQDYAENRRGPPPPQFPQRIAPPDFAGNRWCSGPPQQFPQRIAPPDFADNGWCRDLLRRPPQFPQQIAPQDNDENFWRSGPPPQQFLQRIAPQDYADNRWRSGPPPQQFPQRIAPQDYADNRRGPPPQQLQNQNHKRVPRSKTSSVQNRLKVSNALSSSASGQNNDSAAGSKSATASAPAQQNYGRRDEPKLLEKICRQLGYEEPEYTFVRLKKRIGCRVVVNDHTYSTYPNEYDSEEEARNSGALVAIDEITKEELRQKFPLCSFNDAEIIEEVWKILATRPGGVFKCALPKLFESTLSLSLPKHWWSVVKRTKRLIVEKAPPSDTKFIVFANIEPF